MSVDTFHGAKVALFYNDQLVVYLRDDKPGLRYANQWDFPGGGREGQETPFKCLQREVQEEFEIRLSAGQITWRKRWPTMHDTTQSSWFMVAVINEEQFKNIHFGSEGQKWQLMSVPDYLKHSRAIEGLKKRLDDYLLNGSSTAVIL